jgi:hypothetical protein
MAVALLLIVVSGFIFLYSFKKGINGLFQSVGVLLSLLIVYTFHLNWLLHAKLTLTNSALLIFILDAGLFLLERKKIISFVSSIDFKKSGFKVNIFKKMAVLLLPVFVFLLAFAYFKGDLSTPKYQTPDPGEHYNQMSRTAKSGFMPLFLPGNEMFEASGFNQVFENHHATYFPGSTVPFFFIYNLLPHTNGTMALQLFNIIFYILISLYLFHIVNRLNLLHFRFLKVLLFLIVSLGAFFDFLVTSFSTQLFGLFLLMFFVDSFYDFSNSRKSILPATLGIVALTMSYVYWLPIVLSFIGLVLLMRIYNDRRKLANKLKTDKFYLNFFGFLSLSILLVFGYALAMFKTKLFGYASADGGFNFQEYFQSEVILTLPFAAVGLLVLFKKKRIFLFYFFVSVLIYFLVLAIGYKLEIVSNYTRSKVLYLLVPLVWILTLIGIDKALSAFSDKNVSIFKWIESKIKSDFAIAALIGCIAASIIVISGVSPKLFPLEKNNLKFVLESESENERNFTRDEMKLLDSIKMNHPEALEDNRILVVADYDTALWVFAYSGIWPRTYSLLADGEKNSDIWSPMSFYSAGIADYPTWIKNDKKHFIVIFGKNGGTRWKKNVDFDRSDYDLIEAFGDNELLQLKKNEDVNISYKNGSTAKEKMNPIALPQEMEIIADRNNLVGLSFTFEVSNKRKQDSDRFLFRLFRGGCDSKGSLIEERIVAVNELASLDERDFYRIMLSREIEKLINEKFCIFWDQIDGNGTGVKIIGSKKDGGFLMKEIYRQTIQSN